MVSYNGQVHLTVRLRSFSNCSTLTRNRVVSSSSSLHSSRSLLSADSSVLSEARYSMMLISPISSCYAYSNGSKLDYFIKVPKSQFHCKHSGYHSLSSGTLPAGGALVRGMRIFFVSIHLYGAIIGSRSLLRFTNNDSHAPPLTECIRQDAHYSAGQCKIPLLESFPASHL
jgi:hypothetical protein